MKNSILIILLSFLVIGFAFGQECPPLDNINPESLCTASDGTDGVLIFGDCYSIENTTDISFDIFFCDILPGDLSEDCVINIFDYIKMVNIIIH